MKKLINKILFGTTLPQEYLCFNLNEFQNPLRIVISNSAGEQIDITAHHLFNGYKPLIFSIYSNCFGNEIPDQTNSIHLTFKSDENKKPALLKLKLVEILKIDSSTILIFQGIFGLHNFKNPFNKLLSDARYRFTADKTHNVYLAGNLFDQIKIAYSIPRKIFLVSVGSQNLFNVFPTDLSGSLDKKIFILSLRTGGKASEQIDNFGRCVISEMPAESFAEAYKAGKNHMKELTELENLEIKFMKKRSSKLNIPLPLKSNKYFELESMQKYKLGIHTLHFMKIMNAVSITESSSALAHIHGDYASWRLREGIKTNYLLRNA